MSTFMLILHVVAALLLLGPVTVAVSTFHTQALKTRDGDQTAAGSTKMLHKITDTYGMFSVLVPILGIAVMFTDPATYLKDGRFHLSILLSVIAWGILFFLILPRQKKMVGALGLFDDTEDEGETYEVISWEKAKSQLAMFGGIFSLCWVIIAILMVIPAW